jgi:2-methylcitrate dehydratase PrpD
MVSEKLTEFVLKTRYEDIPARVMEKARQSFIDCLGCMLVGTREPIAEIL